MSVDERMILRESGTLIEVPCNDAAAAPSRRRPANTEYAHPESAPELPVMGLEVDVEETSVVIRSSSGCGIHAERIPLVPTSQPHTEDAVERDLGASLALLSERRRAATLAGEQGHSCKWYMRTRRVVLGIGRLGAQTHSVVRVTPGR
ncbi:hypothetical protein PLEOSDRAFT_1105178 [Pleurotus ostreatus PC15]|uniref:Uncharacterized protein n=2 Tax=Pleurotus TaxID=5320 RepID=A0A067NH16_PLEO1|nr:hypothetical protein CCMSSC00406_0007829 [Pleurotus cornucopiae]KDQ26270.1 hypothetical protein PLEOSDRAFT_1105178 [Pleurotus ostreatus PC15]